MSLIRNALRYGGAPAAYYAPAIMYHPEGAFASLGTALQAGAADSPYLLFAAWVRLHVGRVTGDVIDRKWQGYYELVANAGGAAQSDSEGIPGFAFVVDNTTQPGTIRANVNDATGGAGHQSNASLFGAFKTLQTGWVFVIFAADTSPVGATAKKYNISLFPAGNPAGNVVQKGTTTAAEAAAFNMALSNAAGFGINVTGSNTPPAKFDMAQSVLDVGTNYLDGASNLTIQASKFINTVTNRPVDWGADASSVFGHQPIHYVDGSKTTIAQKGATAAPFTVAVPNASGWVFTPALTPELYNASHSPSGPADARPYEVWTTNDHMTGQITTTVNFANNPLSNFGAPIVLGDLILVIGAVSDTNSAIDRSAGWTCTQPSAINNFALVTMTGDSNPLYNTSTYGSMNTAVFWKIADANDVTASGNGWGNAAAGGADANAPVLTFGGSGTAPRSARWQIHVYRQASSIQAAASKKTGRVTGTTGTWVAPSIAAGANCRLLTGFQIYDNTSFAQTGVQFHLLCPANQDLRFKSYGNVDTKTYTLLSDEAVAAGATGTRSLRVGGTVTTGGTPCNAFSIALGP